MKTVENFEMYVNENQTLFDNYEKFLQSDFAAKIKSGEISTTDFFTIFEMNSFSIRRRSGYYKIMAYVLKHSKITLNDVYEELIDRGYTAYNAAYTVFDSSGLINCLTVKQMKSLTSVLGTFEDFVNLDNEDFNMYDFLLKQELTTDKCPNQDVIKKIERTGDHISTIWSAYRFYVSLAIALDDSKELDRLAVASLLSSDNFDMGEFYENNVDYFYGQATARLLSTVEDYCSRAASIETIHSMEIMNLLSKALELDVENRFKSIIKARFYEVYARQVYNARNFEELCTIFEYALLKRPNGPQELVDLMLRNSHDGYPTGSAAGNMDMNLGSLYHSVRVSDELKSAIKEFACLAFDAIGEPGTVIDGRGRRTIVGLYCIVMPDESIKVAHAKMDKICGSEEAKEVIECVINVVSAFKLPAFIPDFMDKEEEIFTNWVSSTLSTQRYTGNCSRLRVQMALSSSYVPLVKDFFKYARFLPQTKYMSAISQRAAEIAPSEFASFVYETETYRLSKPGLVKLEELVLILSDEAMEKIIRTKVEGYEAGNKMGKLSMWLRVLSTQKEPRINIQKLLVDEILELSMLDSIQSRVNLDSLSLERFNIKKLMK